MPQHRQVKIWLPRSQKTIEVDTKLRKTMLLFDIAGVITLYSCQGENIRHGAANWENRSRRGYILMQHDANSHEFTSALVQNFPLLQPGRQNQWFVEFDNHFQFGPRVCLRFPQRHISNLERFVASYNMSSERR